MTLRDPRGRRNSARPDLELKSIAVKARITPSYLSCILSGKRVPSIEVAERLAAVMGLRGVDELREELRKYKRQSGNGKGKRRQMIKRRRTNRPDTRRNQNDKKSN